MSHNINYVLDPQYTSVMNDIKIMSRGGAKLSEILPNYILKSQKTKECTLSSTQTNCEDTFSVSCPTGYKAAFVAIPTYFGTNLILLDNMTQTVLRKRKFYTGVSPQSAEGVATTDNTRTFTLKLSYVIGSAVETYGIETEVVRVVIQTYCVYEPENIDWNGDGTVDGIDDSPDKKRPVLPDGKTCDDFDEKLCDHYYCRWTGSACVPE